jgi:flavin-dependent dehydrogenase
VNLPPGEEAEITIKRSLFDQLLMERSRELGVDICQGRTVTALTMPNNRKREWTITAGKETFRAKVLVAADGRNSTIARLCQLLPKGTKERIALQTHLPLPRDFGNRVVLQFLPEGYSGQAPVGEGQLNVCLVSAPGEMASLRKWAEARFGILPEQPWRTITPLTRAPAPAAHPFLFLVGDAARVVEPFTGEGIYYALASGELAANAIASQINGQDEADIASEYVNAHAKLYRGRLWINRLARLAVLSPRVASMFLALLRLQPSPLRALTARIVQKI